MKRSTLEVRRSKIKVTRGRSWILRPGEASFSTPFGRVVFIVSRADNYASLLKVILPS